MINIKNGFMLSIVAIVVINFSLMDGVHANCSMYGNPPFNISGAPPKTTPDLVDCPMFNTSHCCSSGQSNNIHQHFKNIVDNVFFDCQACINNLKTLWCHFTCSPRQLDFVEVTKTKPDGQIEEVTYTVCPEFAQDLYNSCEYTPFGGGVIVHQQYPTYEAFLSFMGQKGPFSPFQINFKYESGDKSMCTDAQSCQGVCACNYCPASCNKHKGGKGINLGIPGVDDLNCKSVIPGVSCKWFYFMSSISAVVLLVAVFTFMRKRESEREGYETIQ
eukprot:TRINITY_DN8685_c0_g1_i2.p1 TRINITY_DN8685_c0_g1~~TRINITY_DN8685_c0_g1_i2.p1  ORF type:complete len:274 (-),score=53.82 TRINITY_DN8685_c0_g1_i2:1068-1889(-)